jgi:hypothetical protein
LSAHRFTERHRIAVVQGCGHAVVDFNQLVDTDTALIAAVVAVGAAASALELCARKGRAQLGLGYHRLARFEFSRLGAGIAHPPHQALGKNTAQAGGNQKRRGAHVQQARDG